MNLKYYIISLKKILHKKNHKMDLKLPKIDASKNNKKKLNLIVINEPDSLNNHTETSYNLDSLIEGNYYSNHEIEKNVTDFRNMVARSNTNKPLDKKNQVVPNNSKKVIKPKQIPEKEFNFNNLNQSGEDVNEWKSLIRSLRDRKDLYNYALAKKRSEFKKLNDLVDYFQKSSLTIDLEKAWVIFLWIGENIMYDIDGYINKKLGKNDPESAFNEGKCICQGYSLLFKHLCNSLGIECIKISGYAKGADFNMETKFANQTNHAWNAIKLDNKWGFVDCTWGTGYTTNDGRFVKKFEPYYFLTSPEIFIYDHFSPDYQLQTNKIGLKDFEALPKLKLSYHLFDIKCLTHNQGFIELNKSCLQSSFSCPSSTSLMVNLKETKGDKIESAVYFGRNPATSNYDVQVSIPVARKKYFLNVYAKDTSDVESRLFDEVGKFLIISSKCDDKKEFVKMLNPLGIEYYIFSPVGLNLSKKSTHKFKVYIKDALKVALVDAESKWAYFKKDEKNFNYWYLEHVFDCMGKVTLFAKMKEDKNFDGICFFNVN